MLILGISGSPRKDGNTNSLLCAALAAAEKEGAETRMWHLPSFISSGCMACDYCIDNARCIIHDDISELYECFQHADAVILSSPIYFENVTSWMKTFLDRGQFLWSNKSVKRSLPKLGLFISVASRLNTDFLCAEKTVRVFFLSMGIPFQQSLTFSGFDEPGSIKDSPFALEEAANAGRELVRKLL